MTDALTAYRDQELDLPALCAALGPLIGQLGVITDERVRAVPDDRTIRYYQTLGLLDRPLRYDGRVARYGYKHVLQVLAIKLLQSQGYSLAQIQAALPTATLPELEALLGPAMGAPPAPVQPAPPQPKTVLIYELQPGVQLQIDPAYVPDPQSLLTRIIHALHQN